MQRFLKRAEDLGLLFCFLALILVEAGYVVWLYRLPTFPTLEQPNPSDLQLIEPLWCGRPKVVVSLLPSVLGGMLAGSAWSLVAFFRSKRRAAATVDAHRSLVVYRLERAALWAVLAGAEMLAFQFLR